MEHPQSYDREKFVETAQALEAERLAKLQAWNEKNRDWIGEHGPMPFQVPKLMFGNK